LLFVVYLLRKNNERSISIKNVGHSCNGFIGIIKALCTLKYSKKGRHEAFKIDNLRDGSRHSLFFFPSGFSR